MKTKFQCSFVGKKRATLIDQSVDFERTVPIIGLRISLCGQSVSDSISFSEEGRERDRGKRSGNGPLRVCH